MTLRYRVKDPHGFMTRKDLRQVIYCTWHNRLALSMKLHSVLRRRHHQATGLAGLVSASKDGAFLAAILGRFGVQSVRGSSSRRGPQALLELATMSDRGYDIAITPDGPRGPCYTVQDGVMALAQVTGLPAVPVSYHLNWKLRLKSWDRFQIPLPFSRCEITIGKTLCVPRESSDTNRESLRQQFQTEMRTITSDN
ncbi:MAG TPA: lysophospholipid acyltransferase family protein [Verrucomicrobiae bacterium]